MKGSFYYNFYYSFNPRKPHLIWRLMANTLRAKLMSHKLLRYVDVCVSTKCNLECTHCFAVAFDSGNNAQLSPAKWKDLARQCMDLGCVSFGITGGEPLLYEGLPEIVESLYPERNLITINSNGTLLTEALARELYAKGVDVFQFSLDSFDEAEHDVFRKKEGTYARLFESMRIAKRCGLKVTVVCTVSHETIRGAGVQGIIDFTRREKYLLILSRATPAGTWLGRTDILLTKEDQEYMYNLVKKYAHVRTDMDTNFGPYGCSAATEKLYITPQGYVIPCPFMHIHFGNVADESVETIRNRMLAQQRLSCYSPVCHVAEDTEFINQVLSKTFKEKRVISWREAFGGR